MELGLVGSPTAKKKEEEKWDAEHSSHFPVLYRLQRAFASAIKAGADNGAKREQGQVLISHFKDAESVKCKEVK